MRMCGEQRLRVQGDGKRVGLPALMHNEAEITQRIS